MKQTRPETTAVVLVNTGSPSSPTPAAVRTYLAEFLSDPHVVDLPGWLWKPILNNIILRTRPRRSTAKYQRIWREDGSPLLQYTNNLCHKLQEKLQENQSVFVLPAMLYGQLSLSNVVGQIRQSGIEHIVILPLFPQFSSATTASIIHTLNQSNIPTTILAQYFDHPAYLTALSQHISNFWKQHAPAEKILFSFHGLPVKRIQNGDPYYDQCHVTVKKLAEMLNLNPSTYVVGFQSRFGGGAWLKPNTKEILLDWAKQGVQRVQVFTPGFTIDCLETLHEIEIELAEEFYSAGGKQLQYIPALNDTDLHVLALAEIVRPYLEKRKLFSV
ncbi:MAG: ferrochelatase [Anaerolineaceae bacterium]|nr:ferrochelatase [Anaerolineaceae bacterium]